MSVVSKPNELICRRRTQSAEICDRGDVQDLKEEASDALAPRQPTGDDRDSMFVWLESLLVKAEKE